jgi:hypothetical protein
MLWTLVRHSAWTVARKPAFEEAVEIKALHTQKEAEKVTRNGGVVFSDYKVANDREYSENYPPTVKGLIACVRGKFSRSTVDGAQIYVPRLEENSKRPNIP